MVANGTRLAEYVSDVPPKLNTNQDILMTGMSLNTITLINVMR
jgi:hypothetical protein